MMSLYRNLLTLLILAVSAVQITGRDRPETKRPSELESLLYDPSAPVVKTQFSVILLARDTDCYYHFVPKYAKMQFQFRVITPPGTMARNVVSIIISSPDGDKIHREHFKSSGEMQETVAAESGYYEICLYNSLERFGEKKVRVMFSYTNKGSLEEKIKEANETDALTDEMKDKVMTMIIKTIIMDRHLFFLKNSEGGQFEFMKSMSQYVRNVSMATCAGILAVMYLQVVSLKRLFAEPKSLTPRA